MAPDDMDEVSLLSPMAANPAAGLAVAYSAPVASAHDRAGGGGAPAESRPPHEGAALYSLQPPFACGGAGGVQFASAFSVAASPPPPAVVAAAFRNVSRALLPVFFLLHCLNFIDRTNLAYTAIPMSRDLGMSQRQYGAGSAVFFFGYSFFQIPSQMILRRVGAPLWLSIIATVWGVVAMCMAGANGVGFFYAARLFLGIAEAASFPGSWYYLTLFYPDSRITLPYSVMEAAIMVAQVVGAPVAAALLHLNGVGGLAGWRWLFLLEGTPSALLGASLFFLLPPSPRRAYFLNATQGQVVQAEVDKCRGEQDDGSRSGVALIWTALCSRTLWHNASVKFLKSVVSDGTMLWAPVLIKAMLDSRRTGGDACLSWSDGGGSDNEDGVGDAHVSTSWAVLLTGVPFTLAAFACIAVARHSQATRERVRHVAVPYLAAGALLLALPVLVAAHPALGIAGLTATIVLTECANGVAVSLFSAAMGGPGLAINLAVFNSIANSGGLVGPYLVGFVGERTCSYNAAFWALGATLLLAGTLTLFLHDPTAAGNGGEALPVAYEPVVGRGVDVGKYEDGADGKPAAGEEAPLRG